MSEDGLEDFELEESKERCTKKKGKRVSSIMREKEKKKEKRERRKAMLTHPQPAL